MRDSLAYAPKSAQAGQPAGANGHKRDGIPDCRIENPLVGVS